MTARWSVSLKAEGDRQLSVDEIVELADAVAPSEGIASGLGTDGYGAQIVVSADSRDEAIERGRTVFGAAVATAGLPEFPIVSVEAISEEEDAMPVVIDEDAPPP
jgi:hypothetical protein